MRLLRYGAMAKAATWHAANSRSPKEMGRAIRDRRLHRTEIMSVSNYHELDIHVGHAIRCVRYGDQGGSPRGVAVECEECKEVLIDFELDVAPTALLRKRKNPRRTKTLANPRVLSRR